MRDPFTPAPAPTWPFAIALEGVRARYPRQQHPVHSLPPGFGVKFEPLGPEDRRSIEDVVDEYVRRNPQVDGGS